MIELYVKVNTFVKSLTESDRGATMVEYGIMVALIAAVAIVIVGVLGGQVNDAFTFVSDEMPVPAP